MLSCQTNKRFFSETKWQKLKDKIRCKEEIVCAQNVNIGNHLQSIWEDGGQLFGDIKRKKDEGEFCDGNWKSEVKNLRELCDGGPDSSRPQGGGCCQGEFEFQSYKQTNKQTKTKKWYKQGGGRFQGEFRFVRSRLWELDNL